MTRRVARRVEARRVVASAAGLVRGSNRNPLRTTPGKARRGSQKKNRFALRASGISWSSLRYQVLVSSISDIGIGSISVLVSVSHRNRYLSSFS